MSRKLQGGLFYIVCIHRDDLKYIGIPNAAAITDVQMEQIAKYMENVLAFNYDSFWQDLNETAEEVLKHGEKGDHHVQ